MLTMLMKLAKEEAVASDDQSVRVKGTIIDLIRRLQSTSRRIRAS